MNTLPKLNKRMIEFISSCIRSYDRSATRSHVEQALLNGVDLTLTGHRKTNLSYAMELYVNKYNAIHSLKNCNFSKLCSEGSVDEQTVRNIVKLYPRSIQINTVNALIDCFTNGYTKEESSERNNLLSGNLGRAIKNYVVQCEKVLDFYKK
ncbi:MAG: hypothetical protein HAW67_04350 [Endozoicomonadaceae bacterium]|nr:hypothetical protein [Endozoicomonadaceae bacterium]